MKRRNHKQKSNYINKLRREDEKRIIESGPSIPKKPSLFDSKVTINKSGCSC